MRNWYILSVLKGDWQKRLEEMEKDKDSASKVNTLFKFVGYLRDNLELGVVIILCISKSSTANDKIIKLIKVHLNFCFNMFQIISNEKTL